MKYHSELDRFLNDARLGCQDALGQLLQGCRDYLLLVANCELEKDLQPRVAPSDLVQDTFLEAQRDFHRFAGDSEDELLRWLRRILLNNLHDAVRHHRSTQRRELNREIYLDALSGEAKRRRMPVCQETPRRMFAAREEFSRVRSAIGELPDDQRRVVILRNFRQLPFAEIGGQLERSSEAARKLWARAIRNLQSSLDRDDG